jgi:hypothetical protein
MSSLYSHCVAATAVVVLLAGCSPSGQVKVYPVKGRVTYQGKPMVGGGAITFVPKSDQAGKAPGGTIKPDGTYELGTYTESDGAMAGEFRVIIFQQIAQEREAAPDGSAPTATASLSVAPADQIPKVYSSDRDSPLAAKVEPKSNEIDFELKRQ